MRPKMKEIVIKNLIGRGRPVLLFGATGAGKSRLVRSIVNDNCQKIMKLREGRGMMTVANEKIIATNSPSLPEDSLVIYGKIPLAEKYLLYDDNELLCDILYYSIKAYVDATNKYKSKEESMAAFVEALVLEIDNKIMANTDMFSLAFKIKGNKNIDKKLKELLVSFDIIQLKAIYLSTFLNNKGQFIKEIFKDEVNKKTLLDFKLKENIDKFWQLVIDAYNEQCEELFKEIKDFNSKKSLSFDVDGEAFAILVNDSDIDNTLVKKILAQGPNSISFLIKDLCIYGRNEVDTELENLIPEYFKDGDYNKCYAIKLIDTMGLFHLDNISVESECETLIDILSIEHCNDIIYVLKASNDALNKKSAMVLKELIKTCKRDLNIHICFTHFDEYIIDELNGDDEGTFIDIENIDSSLIDSKIKKLENAYISLLNSEEKGKNVSIYKGFSHFSYPTVNPTVDGLLKSHSMEYNIGIIELLKNVYRSIKRYDISIVDGKEISYSLDVDLTKLYDISNIYFDLTENITECEKSMLNLHRKTYQAAITRWLKYGVKFLSGAGNERTGYIRLKTYFVEYIAIFLNNSIIPSIKFNFEQFKIAKSDKVTMEEFEKVVKKYLSQTVGKKVARDILDETLEGHTMLYDLRLDMYSILDNCRTTYFPRPNISLEEIEMDDKEKDFLSIVNRNIKKSIKEFERTYCSELH